MLISLKNGNTIEVEISWWLSLSDNDQDDFLSNAEMYFYGTEDIDNPFFKSAVDVDIDSHIPIVNHKHFTLDEDDDEDSDSNPNDDDDIIINPLED